MTEPTRHTGPNDPAEATGPKTPFDTPDFEIPDFDPKRTRRAVRGGILRTSLVVLVTLVMIFLVATVGSEAFQRRGDRETRMLDVLGTALQIANPGYEVRPGEITAAPLSLSMEVGVSPRRVQGSFRTGTAFGDRGEELTQDFFGRVRRPPLGHATETPLTYALYNVGTGNQPKEHMRKVLARLPETMNALAVVEFTAPRTGSQLAAFGGQYRSCPDLVVYENRPRSTPITWGTGMLPSTSTMRSGACSDLIPHELANFRAWVGALREYDEPNLRRFGLDLARLRSAASGGKAYAYVDTLSTVGQLRRILDDPLVATVRVAEVAYDLER
ncbi:hypothetical protein GCM10022252_42710 [Streptosporangium oxazolinicum]|uniref:Uncharacterized protein n=1 Tax=Streptosporangium oxazolinicum TaxID=909287 RepID=A0ABP8B263_9ACTN